MEVRLYTAFDFSHWAIYTPSNYNNRISEDELHFVSWILLAQKHIT